MNRARGDFTRMAAIASTPPNFPGSRQVHQRDIGSMLVEECDRFLASSGLRHYAHIGTRIDDGRDAHSHQRVIVHHHDFHLFRVTHNVISATRSEEVCLPRHLDAELRPRADLASQIKFAADAFHPFLDADQAVVVLWQPRQHGEDRTQSHRREH